VLSDLIDETLKETGVPSISIALVRGDEIVWKAAFGYANVRTKTPATPETLYNAAGGSPFSVAWEAMAQEMGPESTRNGGADRHPKALRGKKKNGCQDQISRRIEPGSVLPSADSSHPPEPPGGPSCSRAR
jgi:hypothetical protein